MMSRWAGVQREIRRGQGGERAKQIERWAQSRPTINYTNTHTESTVKEQNTFTTDRPLSQQGAVTADTQETPRR